MKKAKEFAEINGEMWEAELPFCGGCPEYVLGLRCGYEGNGCRFPDRRMEKPRTFQTAYWALTKKFKITDEEVRKLELKEEK